MHTGHKNTSISYVVPAYNAANTVRESVSSIFNNNFKEGDEVIIVNDASTDTTQNVLVEIAKTFYPHVIIVNNETNKGCPASRNIGISQSKNELIFNLDSDNVLVAHSIEQLRQALIANDADVASFQEYHFFKDNPSRITHKWVCVSGQLLLNDFLSGIFNPGPGGNFLYKKQTWQRIGGYWEYGKGLHEAWGFSLKLLANKAKFWVVPNTFYYHRYSHQSLFVTEDKKQNESIAVTNKFIDIILNWLTKESSVHVRNNPNWFNDLAFKPLQLQNQPIGINGKLVYTSKVKNILNKLRNSFK